MTDYALGIREEIRVYGLSDADMDRLDVPRLVSEEQQRAFRQGMVERVSEVLNPHFPDELRALEHYSIGARVVTMATARGAEV